MLPSTHFFMPQKRSRMCDVLIQNVFIQLLLSFMSGLVFHQPGSTPIDDSLDKVLVLTELGLTVARALREQGGWVPSFFLLFFASHHTNKKMRMFGVVAKYLPSASISKEQQSVSPRVYIP